MGPIITMKGNIFIKRPVMAMSIAIVIVLLGAISYFNLPVEQFPDIAPPTVVVSATYPGASAETVTKAVIQPLEESINGVENMTYMTSSSSNSGTATITVFFKQGTNPDMAAVNTQNRVSMAQGLLPQEVTMIGVTTFKRQTSMLQIDAMVSDVPEYDPNFMGNYMAINITPLCAGRQLFAPRMAQARSDGPVRPRALRHHRLPGRAEPRGCRR